MKQKVWWVQSLLVYEAQNDKHAPTALQKL